MRTPKPLYSIAPSSSSASSLGGSGGGGTSFQRLCGFIPARPRLTEGRVSEEGEEGADLGDRTGDGTRGRRRDAADDRSLLRIGFEGGEPFAATLVEVSPNDALEPNVDLPPPCLPSRLVSSDLFPLCPLIVAAVLEPDDDGREHRASDDGSADLAPSVHVAIVGLDARAIDPQREGQPANAK